ncbi:MAG: T9SS C-terminal target domain-containing protein [Ignavibacteriae bacterium]|nr:MAG: T9SS C-terminal target domain-containing protein [Ignavibacteriota bacterium]
MKSIIKILTIILFLTTLLTYSQQPDNWQWMNPKPQGNSLNALDFVSDNVGYAAGIFGSVLKTTDAGINWTKLPTNISKNFLSMSFPNENTGYIGGGNQLMMKTTDAGNTWSNLQLPVQEPMDTMFYVLDIKFLTANTGYALGFFLMESKIWKTTNGGLNWTVHTTGGANYLKELFFIDENNGFAVGGSFVGEVIKTTNGGLNWALVYNSDYALISVYFLNLSTGFAGAENGRVYKTTDAGNTWNSMWSPSSLDINAIEFVNANTGFGFGTGSVFVKSTNGGNNWTEENIGLNSNRQYMDAEITPNGTIHAIGTYGAAIRSTNAGNSFISQPSVTEASISNIKFVNEQTGYAVAGFSAGDILKTTNSGETWVSQISSYHTPLYGISFLNSETGYLAGSINIKKTTNGGTNWVNVYTSFSNEIFGDVFFTNLNTGYAVGSYRKLLKTTNGGLNWSASTIPGSGTFLNSIFFVNDNTGFAAGESNTAVKTTDAGTTWSPMSIPSGSAANNNVFFTDVNTGYMASGAGIFKTTNSGSSWFALNTPSGGYSNVQFRGNFGYAVAGGGKIIKSIDAGASWFIQPTVTSNSLYALYFNTDNFVHAGGLLGTMIKTIPTELIMTPAAGNTNETPESYYLSQNYPNPFNPSTSIKFALPKAGVVSIKIFDITGREIRELVNSNYNAGNYEVKWDANNFSSGIYFYTIKTNGFTETKKMILVK